MAELKVGDKLFHWAYGELEIVGKKEVLEGESLKTYIGVNICNPKDVKYFGQGAFHNIKVKPKSDSDKEIYPDRIFRCETVLGDEIDGYVEMWEKNGTEIHDNTEPEDHGFVLFRNPWDCLCKNDEKPFLIFPSTQDKLAFHSRVNGVIVDDATKFDEHDKEIVPTLKSIIEGCKNIVSPIVYKSALEKIISIENSTYVSKEDIVFILNILADKHPIDGSLVHPDIIRIIKSKTLSVKNKEMLYKYSHSALDRAFFEKISEWESFFTEEQNIFYPWDLPETEFSVFCDRQQIKIKRLYADPAEYKKQLIFLQKRMKELYDELKEDEYLFYSQASAIAVEKCYNDLKTWTDLCNIVGIETAFPWKYENVDTLKDAIADPKRFRSVLDLFEKMRDPKKVSMYKKAAEEIRFQEDYSKGLFWRQVDPRTIF